MRRSGHHTRHRGGHSPLGIPGLHTPAGRIGSFVDQVQGVSEYLAKLWSEQLDGVQVAVDALPDPATSDPSNPYWTVSRADRIVLFHRLPIQRSPQMREADEETRRMLVEYHVYRAFAAYLGREPWELSPRHRF